MPSPTTRPVPEIVIGAGPVGLADPTHLVERSQEPLVLGAGGSVGAAVRKWAHVRLFSPWQFSVDGMVHRLLRHTRASARLPTGFAHGRSAL